MTPYIAVWDDFFLQPSLHKQRIVEGTFRDHKATEDGVIYPGINSQISIITYAEVKERLSEIMCCQIVVRNLFARLTSGGQTAAPNKVHSDYGMGEYASHIYLSAEWSAESGTSFWRHQSGSDRATPTTDFPLLHSHSNDFTKWNFILKVPGKFNRCLIHDATLWHCADPVGGWGTGPEDGRLVLTTFFNLTK